MVQGEVHAKFGPDPSSSLGGEWRQTNKQTDRQTDRHCCIYIYYTKNTHKILLTFYWYVVVCHFRESTVEFVNRCHYLLVISIRVCKLVRYVGSANIDLHGYTAVE